MTDYELEEIRNRERKASPGPWEGHYFDEEIIGIESGDIEVVYATMDHGLDVSASDMEFILKSREDIPALITEIDRLREGLDEISYAFWSEDITQQEVIYEINKMVIALIIGEGEDE